MLERIKAVKADRLKALVIAVIFFSLLFRLVNIDAPLENDRHNFRGTQTAFIAKSMLETGFSLTEFEIPVFGEPWDTVYMEYPVYQIVVFLFMKLFHGSNVDLWCRIVNIISFYFSAYFLYRLVCLETDRRAAAIVSVFYILLPYNIYWSRTAMIEFTSVAFALLYSMLLLRWVREGRALLFAGTLAAGGMAYISKSTTMFGFVYFLALYIPYILYELYKEKEGTPSFAGAVRYYAGKPVYIISLGLLCILPVIPGVLWTRYADMKKQLNPYTAYMTSAGLKEWNFGTLHMRVDWGIWKALAGQFFGYLLGGGALFFLLAVLAFIFGARKYRWLVASCLISSAGVMLTLINLYQEHDYYQIAIVPFTSIAGGVLLYSILSSKELEGLGQPGHKLLTVILCVFFIASVLGKGFFYIDELLSEGSGNADPGLLISEITEPDERILIDGDDWNSRILYYADRKGFMIRDVNTGHFSKDYLEHIPLETEYTIAVTRNESLLEDLAGFTDIGLQYIWDDDGWAAVSGDPDADWFIARMMPESELSSLTEGKTEELTAYDGSYRTDPDQTVIDIRHKASDTTGSITVRAVCSDGSEVEHRVLLLPGTEHTLIDLSLIKGDIEEIRIDSENSAADADIIGIYSVR